jgi:hypothetical protein
VNRIRVFLSLKDNILPFEFHRSGHEIVQFWQIGYRLFHGKLLRFMCGIRNFGQVLDGTSEKFFFDPLKCKVNCAVPNGLYVWKSYYKHRSIKNILKYRRKVTNRGKTDVLSKPLKRRIRMGYTCMICETKFKGTWEILKTGILLNKFHKGTT